MKLPFPRLVLCLFAFVAQAFAQPIPVGPVDVRTGVITIKNVGVQPLGTNRLEMWGRVLRTGETVWEAWFQAGDDVTPLPGATKTWPYWTLADANHTAEIRLQNNRAATPLDASWIAGSANGLQLLQEFTVENAGGKNFDFIVNTDGVQNDGNKPLWVLSTTGPLDSSVFREGIDKVVGAIDASSRSSGGGGGGEIGTLAKVNGIWDMLKGLTTNGNSTFMTNSKISDALTDRTNTAAIFEGPKLEEGSAAGAVTVGAALTNTLATIRVGDRDIVLGWDVFPEAVKTIFVFGRGLLTLALVIGFARSCGSVITEYVATIGTVRAQTVNTGLENLVPTVAQGKHVATAGLAVGAMMAFAAAVVVVLNIWMTSYGFGIGALFGAIDLAPLGAGIELLDRFFPVATSLQLLVMRAGFPLVVGPMYLAASSILRFIQV